MILCSGDLSSVCFTRQSIHNRVVGVVHCHSKVAVAWQFMQPRAEEGIGRIGAFSLVSIAGVIALLPNIVRLDIDSNISSML